MENLQAKKVKNDSLHLHCISVGINGQRNRKLCNQTYSCENTTAFTSSWDWHCNFVATEIIGNYLVEKSMRIFL